MQSSLLTFRPPTLDDRRRLVEILHSWTPHPMDPTEIRTYRRETQAQIQVLTRVYEQRRRIPFGTQRYAEFLRVVAWEQDKLSVVFCKLFRINDLLPELIAHIFGFLVMSAQDERKRTLARLTVTWVCRRWRWTALADATLWNRVWIIDPFPYERSLAFISRAGKALLDIRLTDKENKKMTDEQMKWLAPRLLDKIAQIRFIAVELADWEPLLTFQLCLASAATSLHRSGGTIALRRFFLVRTASPFAWPGTTIPYHLIGHTNYTYPLLGGVPAPNLSTFILKWIHVDWANSVALTNLTNLELTGIPMEHCPKLPIFRSMLAASPALEKLLLDGMCPAFTNEEFNARPQAPIRMYQLHTLVIANLVPRYALQTVKQFHAPRLLLLSFSEMPPDDYSPLLTYFAQASPAIKVLFLEKVGLAITNPTQLAALVRFCDALQDLSYLRLVGIQETVLTGFLINPESMHAHPALVPGLQAALPRPPLFAPLTIPNANGPSRLTAPNLATLEFREMNPATIGLWAGCRKVMGAALNKLYVPVNIDMENLHQLQSVIGSRELVVPLLSGAPLPFEVHRLLARV